MNVVSERIKSCYNSLPASEKLVADYVLQNKSLLKNQAQHRRHGPALPRQ